MIFIPGAPMSPRSFGFRKGEGFSPRECPVQNTRFPASSFSLTPALSRWERGNGYHVNA